MNRRESYLKDTVKTAVYRIRSRYLQFLEVLKNHIPDRIEKGNNNPTVKLIAARDETAIEALAKLYYMNPSPLVISLWKKQEIEARISNGIEFYLCFNDKDELIGATGFDPGRNMFIHSIVRRKERGKGYGSSMYLELMNLKKKKGIYEFRAQAFKNNHNAIRMMKKVGFVIELKEDSVNYVEMVRKS